MNNVRKLQFIGNQFLLNVPRSVAQSKNWRKGDYLAIHFMNGDRIEVTKIADGTVPRAEAVLNALRAEATELNTAIMIRGHLMEAGDYAAHTNRLAHVQAKIRRLMRKIGYQN